MISKDIFNALSKALEDPGFPAKSVVSLTDKQRSTLREVIRIGLSEGNLPIISELGKKLQKAGRGRNDIYLLSLTRVIKNTRPLGHTWEIGREQWRAIVDAAKGYVKASSNAPSTTKTSEKDSDQKVVKSRPVVSAVSNAVIKTKPFKDIGSVIVQLEKDVAEYEKKKQEAQAALAVLYRYC